MDRLEQINALCDLLLEDLPEYRRDAQRFPQTLPDRRRLLRSLMNVRPPLPLKPDFLAAQDALLSAEREERGVVDSETLPPTGIPGLYLWRGDITCLRADAIVNAANSGMLGCFHPCHGCIDNAIHSAAGLQLRDACSRLMDAQGHEEPVGQAKLTAAYNLPARFVLHTVGPYLPGPPTAADRAALASCYRACLQAAGEHGLHSVAFCCISTGEFHFPNEPAAEIAVDTVRQELPRNPSVKRVIFNVFSSRDEAIYRRLLE